MLFSIIFRSTRTFKTSPLRYSHTLPNGNVKTAVLLMNMGGPGTLNEVKPFLRRLFSDPEIIPLPFQKYFGQLIAHRRSPAIRSQYQEIGGGSPIRAWTERQGRGMDTILNEISPESAPHKSYVGFRYASPLAEDAICKMLEDGVRRAVAFSQYPQYSCATTGSSLSELRRQLEISDPKGIIKWTLIDRWPTNSGLINAFTERINEALKRYYQLDQRENVTILFSAHSLPLSYVVRGDTYVGEVAATAHQIMQKVGSRQPFRISWQSKVGPAKWMGPQTIDVLRNFAKEKIRNVLIVPVAFTSDHIETLYELDYEYIKTLREKEGMSGLYRAESLNDSSFFVRAMAERVSSHLRDEEKYTPCYQQTCPGCPRLNWCKTTREYFGVKFIQA